MALAIRLSYHKRLFVILLIFSWVTTLCFIGFQYKKEKQYKSDFLNAQLQLYNKHLLETIEEGLSYEDYIASHEKPFEDLRISIITLGGAVIYDNKIEIKKLENHINRPEIKEAIKEGAGYNIERQSKSDGQEYFYSATLGKRVIVRTALPYSVTLKDLLRADWSFVFLMISIGLVMSIFIYFATKRLGKNIEKLNTFATKAEKGESLDKEVSFPNDELGSISNHIVQLYFQWQQTIKDRDIAYQNALRQEQEKIRIKKELTNNINHELKTPVASMQVCLETLLSGIKLSEEKRQELLARCYSNNERLRHLLSDVSLLTRLEDGNNMISKEPILINDIIKEISQELEIMPKEERFVLHADFKEEVRIEGNRTLIGSIFSNLTENTIAYSGGKNIYISLIENNEKWCSIGFEDDGCGVKEEDLPRLFERFYRIDKGRSRQMGGTGLGLAIVKHAVQFHGGKISVSNRPTGGLRFNFSLKKDPIAK
ncbi:MAG: HAMP domain-containing sensor histidine kinase [Bacteroidota bacterium]|nr:HAMP domain-containing sensor histidine kinase [Bacteroidota bacterium]